MLTRPFLNSENCVKLANKAAFGIASFSPFCTVHGWVACEIFSRCERPRAQFSCLRQSSLISETSLPNAHCHQLTLSNTLFCPPHPWPEMGKVWYGGGGRTSVSSNRAQQGISKMVSKNYISYETHFFTKKVNKSQQLSICNIINYRWACAWTTCWPWRARPNTKTGGIKQEVI